MNSIRSIARRILSMPSAPFHESAVREAVLEWAKHQAHLLVATDSSGNITIRRRRVRSSSSPFVLSAHMDHPGFEALRCRRDGSVYRIDARFLGGVRLEYFRGAAVRFFDGAAEVSARVQSIRRPRGGHDLRVRLRSRKPVSVRAFGMWDLPRFRVRSGGLIETRAADDLGGVTAVLAFMERVDRADPRRRVDVRGLLTRAEEVGFIGALAAAQSGGYPGRTRFISIETSKATPAATLGGGPVLRTGDRASVFDDRLTRQLGAAAARLAARKRSFRWRRALMDGGTCEATAFQALGFKAAGLCVPLDNYHNMSPRPGSLAPERIHEKDLTDLVEWLLEWVRGESRASAGVSTLRRRLMRTYTAYRGDLI